MDAEEGTAMDVGEVGRHLSVGLRPCAHMAEPSEQMFRPLQNGGFKSRFPDDFCLSVEGDDDSIPEYGDRIRLGNCGTDMDSGTKPVFNFDKDAMLDGRGKITVAPNSSLCVTNEGNNPGDNDRMVDEACQDSDKFFFSFRTSWFQIGSGTLC